MPQHFDLPSDQICKQTASFISQAIDRWKNAPRATTGLPRHQAAAKLASVYDEFIANGFQWNGLLPVFDGDVDFQKKVLFGSVMLNYDIAEAGIVLASLRAGLPPGRRVVPLWSTSEYDRLCAFAETLSQEIDNQIAVADRKTSNDPQITMH